MKKQFKKILFLTGMFVMMLSLGITAGAASKKKKASIKLDKSSVSVSVGKSVQLNAAVTGKSSKVTWSSGDKSYAIVSSSGKVTGKKEGKVTVYAKANGKTAKCTVTVKKTVSKKITKKQAIKAMNKYYERYTEQPGSAWITYQKKTGGEYCFNCRSYTGAQGKFYVRASNGKIYCKWKSPVTNKWDKKQYAGNAHKYL